ncbi:MAG: hypothetical protein MUF22_04235 [Chitinispirillaceae bacterium]|nr:hypothetical protein [Chitinispirillaceae bacterium]
MKNPLIVILALLIPAMAGVSSPMSIPAHPSKLPYDSLRWMVPLGDAYRVTMKNGLAAYVAADSLLPIVQISAYIRSGTLLDRSGNGHEAQ